MPVDHLNKSIADTPSLFRIVIPSAENKQRRTISEAGDVLEFLLFGGSLNLVFRTGDIPEQLLEINAVWFRARGSAMYEGGRLGDLAIIGPWLAHHILTAQPLPRLTVKIVRELMKEDRSITREFMDMKVKDGKEWDLPLPEAWEIPDVEANFAGRVIVDENDRASIRMYRAVLHGYHGEKRLGTDPPLVSFPPAPRWYPKTLSSVLVLAMLVGWAYVCSLPRLNPFAMMYKEHWAVVEHYLPLFGHGTLAVMALVFVCWPVRWPLWIIGNINLVFVGVPPSLMENRYIFLARRFIKASM
jgi:hypothetical protein